MIIDGAASLDQRRARMRVARLWFLRACLTLPGGGGYADLLDRIEKTEIPDRRARLYFDEAAEFDRIDPDLEVWAALIPLTAARLDQVFTRAIRLRRKYDG